VAEQQYNYTVLRHVVNQGKGRALKTAFNELLNREEPVFGCVTADSDGQHTPLDICRCMDMLKQHPQALVMGCREFTSNQVSFKSKLGNELTRTICSFLCGIQVSNTQTGLRGVPREFMKELLNVPGERFELETNMLIACKNRIEIQEVPIQTVYDSKVDHKTHFDPVRDSIRIYKILAGCF
ncbi:glycosyltransferase, group 2 family protein, partial [gut metagenome]